ncbi:MAG: hypothetical protein LBR07_08430 [Puniceicoccales bacterium]|jgi:hypothetical protein|nr:hypothetical protein [Puniceicoccales bacterium]
METTDENPSAPNAVAPAPGQTPAENHDNIPQPTTETTDVTAKNPAPDSEKTAPAPQNSTRLAESALESALADLPPLSTLPATGANGSDAQGGNGEQTAPAMTRRGLGRGASGGADKKDHPNIGVIENPAEISETLSGKFVNGYEDAPRRDRTSGNEAVSLGATNTSGDTSGDTSGGNSGAPEFQPPVSTETHKAELDPERTRRDREERRGRRGGRGRGGRDRERDGRAEAREPFFGERREDQPAEWSPGDSSKNNGEKRRQNAPATPSGPRRFTVEPPEIPPPDKEDSLWTKIKEFIANIFGGKRSGKPRFSREGANTGGGRDGHGNNRDGRNFDGNGGDRRRGGRGRRGGRFRHGNSGGGGNPQNPNRDARHRPHGHG